MFEEEGIQARAASLSKSMSPEQLGHTIEQLNDFVGRLPTDRASAMVKAQIAGGILESGVGLDKGTAAHALLMKCASFDTTTWEGRHCLTATHDMANLTQSQADTLMEMVADGVVIKNTDLGSSERIVLSKLQSKLAQNQPPLQPQKLEILDALLKIKSPVPAHPQQALDEAMGLTMMFKYPQFAAQPGDPITTAIKDRVKHAADSNGQGIVYTVNQTRQLDRETLRSLVTLMSGNPNRVSSPGEEEVLNAWAAALKKGDPAQ